MPENAKHLQTFKATYDDIEDMITWIQNESNTFIEYVDNYTYKALFCFYYDTGITLSETLAIVKNEAVKNVVSVFFL